LIIRSFESEEFEAWLDAIGLPVYLDSAQRAGEALQGGAPLGVGFLTKKPMTKL